VAYASAAAGFGSTLGFSLFAALILASPWVARLVASSPTAPERRRGAIRTVDRYRAHRPSLGVGSALTRRGHREISATSNEQGGPLECSVCGKRTVVAGDPPRWLSRDHTGHDARPESSAAWPCSLGWD